MQELTWSVETMHWLLDVHFDEDRCRVQSKNIQQNLNMLHKVALNIIRIYKREAKLKLPLNGIMFRALMNPYELLAVLGKNFNSVILKPGLRYERRKMVKIRL